MSQVPESHSEHRPVDPRWDRVVAGLRLAGGPGGCFLGAAVAVYLVFLLAACGIAGLWRLVGPLFGWAASFQETLGALASYGLVVLIAGGGAAWYLALLAKYRYCAVPEPPLARSLARIAFLGHVAILPAVIYLAWLNLGFCEGMTVAAQSAFVVGCLMLAWIGLIADWRFAQALSRFLALDPRLARMVEEQAGTAPVADDSGRAPTGKKKLLSSRAELLGLGLLCIAAPFIGSDFGDIHTLVIAMRVAIFTTLFLQACPTSSATSMEEVQMRMARLKARTATLAGRKKPC